jgi:RHS repeat-associated protein
MLYYFGVRYYDPVTGRFTLDTVFGDLDDPQSLNRYSYFRNNPKLKAINKISIIN